MSSFVAPCLIAASVWTVIQPSHRKLTATASAMSSRDFRSEPVHFLASCAEVHVTLDRVRTELADFLDSGGQLFAIVVPIEHHGQCSPRKLLRQSLTGDMVTETNGQVTIPWYLNSVIIPVAWW
jgi:hypothetical protein